MGGFRSICGPQWALLLWLGVCNAFRGTRVAARRLEGEDPGSAFTDEALLMIGVAAGVAAGLGVLVAACYICGYRRLKFLRAEVSDQMEAIVEQPEGAAIVGSVLTRLRLDAESIPDWAPSMGTASRRLARPSNCKVMVEAVAASAHDAASRGLRGGDGGMIRGLEQLSASYHARASLSVPVFEGEEYYGGGEAVQAQRIESTNPMLMASGQAKLHAASPGSKGAQVHRQRLAPEARRLEIRKVGSGTQLAHAETGHMAFRRQLLSQIVTSITSDVARIVLMEEEWEGGGPPQDHKQHQQQPGKRLSVSASTPSDRAHRSSVSVSNGHVAELLPLPYGVQQEEGGEELVVEQAAYQSGDARRKSLHASVSRTSTDTVRSVRLGQKQVTQTQTARTVQSPRKAEAMKPAAQRRQLEQLAAAAYVAAEATVLEHLGPSGPAMLRAAVPLNTMLTISRTAMSTGRAVAAAARNDDSGDGGSRACCSARADWVVSLRLIGRCFSRAAIEEAKLQALVAHAMSQMADNEAEAAEQVASPPAAVPVAAPVPRLSMYKRVADPSHAAAATRSNTTNKTLLGAGANTEGEDREGAAARLLREARTKRASNAMSFQAVSKPRIGSAPRKAAGSMSPVRLQVRDSM